MSHKSLPIYPILIFLLALMSACEESDQHSSERVVFNVSADESQFSTNNQAGNIYSIATSGNSFFNLESTGAVQDSLFNPERLEITITLSGDLIPSLIKNPNGYRVNTQFQFEGGIIQVSHTNQASTITNPEGDTLYAIRGEGMVSSGDETFKNISGLFYEESTYKISPDTSEQSSVQRLITKIDCRYELIIDF